MSDELDKKRLLQPNAEIKKDEEEGGSDSGTGTAGGAAGDIEFHYQDILSVGLREDLVTGKELKRLMSVHEDLHKARVDNQKLERKKRKQLKEGVASLTSRSETILANRARIGGGYGGTSNYKKHPVSDKAQFSGIDRQVTALPSENAADTNKNDRNELENRNELKLSLSNKYRNTPKPRPYH